MKNNKIAILITGGDIHSRKGLLNACLCRAIYLKKIADYQIDVYYLQEEFRKFKLRDLFGPDEVFDDVELDGCNIKVLWGIEYYAEGYIRKLINLYYRITGVRITGTKWLEKYTDLFRDYDMLTVHSRHGAYVAENVKKKYGIPYFITWHGSDIHTLPFENPAERKYIVSAMESAECSFFVSEALLKVSDELTVNACKKVIYNGVNEDYHRFDDEERHLLRSKYGLKDEKVVAFAGSLYPVKNADILPEIFAEVSLKYKGNVAFWIVGDGKLRPIVEKKLDLLGIRCRIWGNMAPSLMPEIYNCVDVLVLPSRREGFPLVTIEALACGANVIGSDAGGIPEAIGEAYCVKYETGFIDRISDLIVYTLEKPVEQLLDMRFQWPFIAEFENSYYENYV